eukprot:TRINITY_DN1996_c0_g1_i5.p1 TRINITY_DN1996_c0_g1~~TRINITY_DN1996_c0_g1_i5.p1  ORF type:complete len:267 (-),score=44.87 TRINITY_DN1996_c0_g1_i5:153-953(-)
MFVNLICINLCSENIDVITFRNNLNKILKSPYSNDDWKINIIRFSNTVHLGVEHLPRNDYPNKEKYEYWGEKFEHYCTHDGDFNDAFNPNDEFCSVVRVNIDKYRLIMAAEIDCYEVVYEKRKKTRAKKEQYVELKTHKIIRNDRDDFSFKKYKLLTCWVQSYLAGVPKIIIGHRNNDGLVKILENHYTLNIPKYANGWDYRVCLQFCKKILDIIKENTTNGNRYTLQRAHDTIILTEVTYTESDDYIPQFYKDYLNDDNDANETT